MADKTKDAKKDDARMSSIAKTLNKVEESGHTYGCEDGGLKEFLAQETKAQSIA